MHSGAEEGSSLFGDQLRHLVGDEVAAAVDVLGLHRLGVALVAGEELVTQGGVAGAEEELGGGPGGARRRSGP